jgi:trehalose-phosphatase
VTLRRAVKECLLRQRALILLSDFDGTLAPIVDRPENGRLPPRARQLLTLLAQHPAARVGVVSGRTLGDVARLVRVPGAAYAGCHGLDIAWRRLRFRHPRAIKLLPLVRQATRLLKDGTRRVPGVLVEPKGLTVSLHYRLADPAVVPALRRLVGRIVRQTRGLEMLKGKKVLELRPRIGWGKARAVVLTGDWLTASLASPRPLTIYLGDDETDEEVFRALAGRAITVAVGSRRTAAAFRLRDPWAVRTFLTWLVCLLPAGRGPTRRGERGNLLNAP